MKRMEQIHSDVDLIKFEYMRMKLTWIAKIRPDLVLEMSQNARIDRDIYEAKISRKCKRLSKTRKDDMVAGIRQEFLKCIMTRSV